MLDRVKILNLAHDTRRDMGHDEQHEDDDDQEPHLCEGTKPAKRSARIKRSEQQRSLVESETTPLTNQQHYEDTTNSLASTNHAGASPMLSPVSNHDEVDARGCQPAPNQRCYLDDKDHRLGVSSSSQFNREQGWISRSSQARCMVVSNWGT